MILLQPTLGWGHKGSKSGTFVQNSGTLTQLDYFLMRRSQIQASSRQVRIRSELPFVPTTGIFYSCQRDVIGAPPNRGTHRGGHVAGLAFCFRSKSVASLTIARHGTTTSQIRELWGRRQAMRQATQTLMLPPYLRDSKILFQNVLHYWQLHAQVRKSNTALQKHCRERKKQNIESLVQEATMHNGSLTGLHRITKRVAPKPQSRRMQLRGPQGELLSSEGQLLQIHCHSATSMQQINDARTLRGHAVCNSMSRMSLQPSSIYPTRLCLASFRLLRFGDSLLPRLRHVCFTTSRACSSIVIMTSSAGMM